MPPLIHYKPRIGVLTASRDKVTPDSFKTPHGAGMKPQRAGKGGATMANKKVSRKDHRGRVLPPNVSQKADLRYIWRKTVNGHRYVVTDNDLNELKKKIIQKEAAIQSGLYTNPQKITLNEWFKKWMEVYKSGLKPTSRENYFTAWKSYVEKSRIGSMQIANIRRMHIVELYRELAEKDLATATVHNVHIIIYGCLSDAVEDNIIQINPANNAFRKIKRKEPKRREALTVRQQEKLIDFLAGNDFYRLYVPLFSFFLGTGCRFGEVSGLTWGDIDLKKNLVSINHTMHYTRIEGSRMRFYTTTPKSKSSIREIPLLQDVRRQLLKQRQYDLMTGIKGDAVIDGYTDFVFHTDKGKPYTQSGINAIISRIVNAHNREEMEKAGNENREPELLPDFSPHILRHTFCTRFCENESNIKVIQKIMGHQDITTTMNIYSHVTKEKAQEVMQELEGKIRIC